MLSERVQRRSSSLSLFARTNYILTLYQFWIQASSDAHIFIITKTPPANNFLVTTDCIVRHLFQGAVVDSLSALTQVWDKLNDVPGELN